MFERCVQTPNHFRRGFEERLRFRLGYFVNVAAQMFDQYLKFFPNIRGFEVRRSKPAFVMVTQMRFRIPMKR